MPKERAHSTYTLSHLFQNQALWTNLQTPIERGKIGRYDLKILGGTTRTFSVTSGALLTFDGLVLNGKQDAHLTLTGDTRGNWTYFHLTVAGSVGKSAYYELFVDDDGDLSVAPTDLTVKVDNKEKLFNVSNSENFYRDPPPGLKGDVEAIIHGLIGKNVAKGQRPLRKS